MQDCLHGSLVYSAIYVLFGGVQAAFCLPLNGQIATFTIKQKRQLPALAAAKALAIG
jgi:hypothetical protein